MIFPIGDATVAVTIDPTDDTTVELSETVVLTVTDDVPYDVGTPGSDTGTITNDDSAVISVSGVTASENAGMVDFTVTISNPVDVAVTVEFDTLLTGTVQGGDFTTLSNVVVTFAANSTTAQIVTVTVTDDALVEATTESLDAEVNTLTNSSRSVSLSGGGASTGATSNITDDESASVAIVAGTTSVSEAVDGHRDGDVDAQRRCRCDLGGAGVGEPADRTCRLHADRRHLPGSDRHGADLGHQRGGRGRQSGRSLA